MDDDTNTPDLDILKGLSFAPGWAKEPPKPQTYESFSHDEDRNERGGRGPFRGGRPERRFGSDRPSGGRFERRDDRRGDREDRPPRDGDRPPRPFRRDDRPPRDGDRPPRPFRRDDRPAPAEGEGSRRPFGDRPPRRDGDRFERGPGRGDRRPPREPPVDIATLPVEVKIIPDQKALSVIVFKVAHTHRAYPVRGLSRLFLENTGSCNVRLEVKADHPDVMLHQCPVCGQIDTDADHLAAHMLAEHFDDFFEKVTVEDAEPTGAFTSIAKCGLSGRLIGPPNHHSFARRFREIKGEVAPRMSDEDYRRRMEIVHDPEVVTQWKQEARIRTLFRRKPEETAAGAAAAAAPESHTDSTDGTDAAAPTAAPESHAENAEAAVPETPVSSEDSSSTSIPDSRPEQAGASPADPGASPAGADSTPVADEPLLERGAAEDIVRSQIVPKRMLTRKRFVCSVEQAEAIRDPQIAPAFRVVWRREQTTPTTLFHAVRGALRSRKFHLFRAGNASGMEFVLAKVPTPLDITHAVPELVQIMDYVTKHEGCTRAELFAALGIPMEGTRTAEQDRLYQQFAWIVERGHLIEYHNGVLALPAEFPKFRNLPTARKAPAAAAPATAPESHTDGTDGTDAAAPADAPAEQPSSTPPPDSRPEQAGASPAESAPGE